MSIWTSLFTGFSQGAVSAAIKLPTKAQQSQASMDQKTQKAAAGAIDPKSLPVMCAHNGRGETTAMDIVEHIGNQEFGSAGRDAWESSQGQAVREVVKEALQEIGDSMNREDGN